MKYTMMSKQWREDIILATLQVLSDGEPRTIGQISYRINRYAGAKSYFLDEYLKSMNQNGLLICICNRYRITDKGIKAHDKLKQLLDMWK